MLDLAEIRAETQNFGFVRFPVSNPTPKDEYLVRKVTGLGPADINVFMGEHSRDGGSYQGRRSGFRNPVITLELNPDSSIMGSSSMGLRTNLYTTFLSPYTHGEHVKLVFLYLDPMYHLNQGPEELVKYIVGYVERIESDLFAEENLVNISMVCPDPLFRNENETVLYPDSPDATNPFNWESAPLLYSGSAPTGFEATISIAEPTNTIMIENNPYTEDEDESMLGRMRINWAFEEGDKIELSTLPETRKLDLVTPLGVRSSLLPGLTPTSRWLELHPQENTLRVYGEDTASTPATFAEVRYRDAYWGI